LFLDVRIRVGGDDLEGKRSGPPFETTFRDGTALTFAQFGDFDYLACFGGCEPGVFVDEIFDVVRVAMGDAEILE